MAEDGAAAVLPLPGRGSRARRCGRRLPKALPAAEAVEPVAGLAEEVESEEAFLVNGSTSGGLAQASDDETRRRAASGRRGSGRHVVCGWIRRRRESGGASQWDDEPERSNDNLGLGGFGASALLTEASAGATGVAAEVVGAEGAAAVGAVVVGAGIRITGAVLIAGSLRTLGTGGAISRLIRVTWR